MILRKTKKIKENKRYDWVLSKNPRNLKVDKITISR